MTGPLAGAVAGLVGPVVVAEEAVAAAGTGPVAAAEEAVAAAGAAVVEALASCRHQRRRHQCPSKHVPTHQRRCLSALWRPTRSPRRNRRSSSGRGSGADAAPASHPTYAGTHSAKSSAVAYSRLTNPRRGPTGSAEETDACFIVCDHNRQALAYVYLQIAGIVGGALESEATASEPEGFSVAVTIASRSPPPAANPAAHKNLAMEISNPHVEYYRWH